MALKNFAQLSTEIDDAVHTNGPRGKTTAADLNALLKSLATELIARTESVTSLPAEVLAALSGSSSSPSATNRFLTEDVLLLLREELDLFRLNRANLVRANGAREYFAGHEAALLAAQSGDTVVIPAPIADLAKIKDQEQLNIRSGVSVQTAGFPIGSPTTIGDSITLRGGKGKLLGGGSTVYNSSSGSWGLGNYNNPEAATIDYDIEQLHFISTSVTGPHTTSSAITIQGAANVRYSGNLTASDRALHVRINGQFHGTGSIVATGTGSTDLNAILCNQGARITWRGFITLQASTRIGVFNGSTIHLERCLVDGTTLRTAGADLLIDGTGAGDNTLILTDTTVLGKPGVPVITAKKVILRGSTVVIGTITADQLLDERPPVIATSGSGTPA